MWKRISLVAVFGMAAVVWLMSYLAFATVQGRITGPQSKLLAGASLMIENPANGDWWGADADAQGNYRVRWLPPGTYVVKALGVNANPQQVTLSLERGRPHTKDFQLQLRPVQSGSNGQVSFDLRGMWSQMDWKSTVTGRSHGNSRSTGLGAVASRYPSAGVMGGIIGGVPGYAPPPLPRSVEQYNAILEQAFLETLRNPLSTFAIDVDTAAYANIRRMLKDGSLPPKDAVRIEEMLNYFRFEDALPTGPHPFAISTEAAPCPWNSAHQLLRIGLRSRAIDTRGMPPAHLTFLVDVSGSMDDPRKLPLLKAAFHLLIDQLRESDRVALVVYAGNAGLVLDSTDGSQKMLLHDAIDRLEAGGSTAGGAGIHLAYALARRNFQPGAVNRVILATDGDFNVGVSSEQELIRLIEEERRSGVYLTVLGFGTGNLQDGKMEGLSRHGNGNYAYVDDLPEARRVLVEQIGATLVTVAKDVKVQVAFNPARVARHRLIGYENRLMKDEEFRDDQKDAGELGAGHSVTALYEITPVAGSSAAAGAWAKVRARYKPTGSETALEFSTPVTETASNEIRFAMVVAEFGLLLRQSPHRGTANYGSILRGAEQALAARPDPARQEFLTTVRRAAELSK